MTPLCGCSLYAGGGVQQRQCFFSQEERRGLSWEQAGDGPMLPPLTISFSSPTKPCCLPQQPVLKDACRLHRENDQIMTNMEHWAKEQK